MRPGCKGLPGTNPLTYNEKSELTAVTSSITFAPGSNRHVRDQSYENFLPFTRFKHSSLFRKISNYDLKKLCNFTPGTSGVFKLAKINGENVGDVAK
jgi:hypothetical protein